MIKNKIKVSLSNVNYYGSTRFTIDYGDKTEYIETSIYAIAAAMNVSKKLNSKVNRDIVKSAFKTIQDNYDKLKEDNALLLDALKCAKELLFTFKNVEWWRTHGEEVAKISEAILKVESK